MRLVSPSVGECADRLSILELKVEFGKQRGIDVEHFKEESRQIIEYVKSKQATSILLDKPYQSLRSVNRGLWHLEGKARSEKGHFTENPKMAAELLNQITVLNDRRAELVNQIDGTPAKEKLY